MHIFTTKKLIITNQNEYGRAYLTDHQIIYMIIFPNRRNGKVLVSPQKSNGAIFSVTVMPNFVCVRNLSAR